MPATPRNYRGPHIPAQEDQVDIGVVEVEGNGAVVLFELELRSDLSFAQGRAAEVSRKLTTIVRTHDATRVHTILEIAIPEVGIAEHPTDLTLDVDLKSAVATRAW